MEPVSHKLILTSIVHIRYEEAAPLLPKNLHLVQSGKYDTTEQRARRSNQKVPRSLTSEGDPTFFSASVSALNLAQGKCAKGVPSVF